ncbi:MAG: flagellar export chaperone FliS [Clostridiaceae bacterium]|nr:flagellar export chaperone FliS [Clostridiaceae bacterium]
MTINNAYAKYREQSILTAGPGDLVLMLYDGCLKQMRLAKAAIEASDLEKASQSLMKAQDILAALMQGLDLDISLSADLLSLYEFLHHELVMANVNKDASRIAPVEEMVTDLRATWEQVVRESRGQVRAAGE